MAQAWIVEDARDPGRSGGPSERGPPTSSRTTTGRRGGFSQEPSRGRFRGRGSMDLDVPPEEDAGAGVSREGDRERVRARPRLREVLDNHDEVRERPIGEAGPLDCCLRPLDAHGGDERGGERQPGRVVDVVDLPFEVGMRHEVEVPLATGLIRLDRTAPRDLSGHGRGPASDDEIERARRVDVLEEWVPDDLAETE